MNNLTIYRKKIMDSLFKKLPRTYYYFFLFLYTQHVYANTSDTIPAKKSVDLEVFTIKETPLSARSNTGKITKIDSATRQIYEHQNLGQLLAAQSPIYIKSYGAGGSSTVSFRGTGASHTQIFWNGLPLNSVSLGVTDLSLIPVDISDDIQVHYGSNSLFRQSSAFGGSIHLNSHADWDNRLNVNLSQKIASFGTNNTLLKMNLGNATFQSSTHIGSQKAKNDFNLSSDIAKRQPENLHQYYINQEFFWKVHPKHTITAKFWYNDTKRNIQPIVLTPDKNEHQVDKSFRGLLTWDWQNKKGVFYQLKGAYINEFLQYTNKSTQLKAVTENRVLYAHLLSKKVIKDVFLVESQTTFTHSEVASETILSYEETPVMMGPKTENRFTFGPYFTWLLHDKLQIHFLNRREVVGKKLSPTIYQLGVFYTPFQQDWLQVKVNTGKNYRTPTLNDLYYNPGGNPNLLPELGWMHETNILLKKHTNNLKANFELTGYYSKIDNWIIWLPAMTPSINEEEDEFFEETVSSRPQPQNLQLVVAKGIEADAKINWFWKDWNFETSANYGFTRSTNLRPTQANDNSVGKQLPYVPFHKLNINLYAGKSGYSFRYNQSIVGKRYISTDNDEFFALPVAYMGNLHASKAFKWKHTELVACISVNNIWDGTYTAIAQRPMPPRNYVLSVSFNFNK